MIRVLHSSDLHGGYKALFKHSDFDVWLDTGDFFDNAGRSVGGGRISAEAERKYQHRWLFRYKDLPRRITEWLNGRPALILPGNHDFIDLSGYLARAGANVHAITTAGVECLGLRWAGFREIPYIDGEWVGEIHDFSDAVFSTWAAEPDILVTHGPPGGILDTEQGYGSPALTKALAYQPHGIRVHFFGHCHWDGGKVVEEMGVRFINGACRAMVHELW